MALYHVILCILAFITFWVYAIPLCMLLVNVGFEKIAGPLFDYSVELDGPRAFLIAPFVVTLMVLVIAFWSVLLTLCVIGEGLLLAKVW